MDRNLQTMPDGDFDFSGQMRYRERMGDSMSRDLQISRLLKAPRERIWRAWSDPALLAQWWCPLPWKTEVRALEFRPGGSFHTFMRGPEGGESDNPGCFLEITPMSRIVWTSMLTGGWRPQIPWMAMTAIFEFSDEEGGTRYNVTALHPSEKEADHHKELGFFEGWNIVIDQLEALAQRDTNA